MTEAFRKRTQTAASSDLSEDFESFLSDLLVSKLPDQKTKVGKDINIKRGFQERQNGSISSKDFIVFIGLCKLYYFYFYYNRDAPICFG